MKKPLDGRSFHISLAFASDFPRGPRISPPYRSPDLRRLHQASARPDAAADEVSNRDRGLQGEETHNFVETSSNGICSDRPAFSGEEADQAMARHRRRQSDEAVDSAWTGRICMDSNSAKATPTIARPREVR